MNVLRLPSRSATVRTVGCARSVVFRHSLPAVMQKDVAVSVAKFSTYTCLQQQRQAKTAVPLSTPTKEAGFGSFLKVPLEAATEPANEETLRGQWTFRTAQIPTSIKKLILVAKLIRGLPVSRAVSELKMSKKRAAVRVLAAINRAHKSIQHNNNRYDITTSNLVIDQAWIGKGQTLKRINIHGRGRTGKMTRPFTHMKMVFKEVKEKPKHPLYPTPEERIKIKLEEDWEKIQDLARRHALYVQLPERRPLQKRYPVWSCKPWKYVSSKKWNDPANGLGARFKPRTSIAAHAWHK